MGQARKGVPPHLSISAAAALVMLLVVLLEAPAYWRVESLAPESHSQT